HEVHSNVDPSVTETLSKPERKEENDDDDDKEEEEEEEEEEDEEEEIEEDDDDDEELSKYSQLNGSSTSDIYPADLEPVDSNRMTIPSISVVFSDHSLFEKHRNLSMTQSSRSLSL